MNFFYLCIRKIFTETYFSMEGLCIFTWFIISVETFEDCEDHHERDDKEEQANTDVSAERVSIVSLNSKLFGSCFKTITSPSRSFWSNKWLTRKLLSQKCKHTRREGADTFSLLLRRQQTRRLGPTFSLPEQTVAPFSIWLSRVVRLQCRKCQCQCSGYFSALELLSRTYKIFLFFIGFERCTKVNERMLKRNK